jgi:hypothetical protein
MTCDSLGRVELVRCARALIRSVPELGVEHPGKQLDHGDQSQPRGPLLRVQPAGLHASSIVARFNHPASNGEDATVGTG